MYINDERSKGSINVQDLSTGDIFEYENVFYILTDDPDTYVAVNLEDGSISDFDGDTRILLTHAVLNVTD